MKTLVLFFVLFGSASFASTPVPYLWMSCESDEVRVKAYKEGCAGMAVVSEIGKGSTSIKKTCAEEADKLDFTIHFHDTDRGEYLVSADTGYQSIAIHGQFNGLTYSDEFLKIYDADGEVRLSNELTKDVSQFSVTCKLEINGY